MRKAPTPESVRCGPMIEFAGRNGAGRSAFRYAGYRALRFGLWGLGRTPGRARRKGRGGRGSRLGRGVGRRAGRGRGLTPDPPTASPYETSRQEDPASPTPPPRPQAGQEPEALHETASAMPADTRPRSSRVAVVDAARCTGCGACAAICPMGAIAVDAVASIETLRCAGCGLCVEECPQGAITLHRT